MSHLAPDFLDAVRSVVSSGVGAAEIRQATLANERTVRRWIAGETDPQATPRLREKLDDLHAIVEISREAGISENGLRAWLWKRNPLLDWQPPLDAIARGEFEAVRAAAAELAFERRLGPSRIYPDELSAQAAQHSIIKTRSPARVRFLEYSAAAVDGLISSCLTTDGVREIELLIRQISDMPPWHLLNRFKPTFIQFPFMVSPTKLRREGKTCPRFRVRCYRVGRVFGDHEYHPSLRARSYGDAFVAAGLYTYEFRPGEQEEEGNEPEPQIWGHDNPVSVVNAQHPEGAGLLTMFNRVWTAVWEPEPPAPQLSVPLQSELENTDVREVVGEKFADSLRGWLDEMDA